MENFKRLGFAFLTFTLLAAFGSLQSCDPDDRYGDDYKPNIYLYPQKQSQVEVKLSFPLGGEVTTSIPNYHNGWNVNINPSGVIDKQYGYLFYESKQPNRWQMKKGWVVKQKDLQDFFTSNLNLYGFRGKEVKDFTDYWIPRLKRFSSYKIYPQEAETINRLISLSISPKPDNMLRLHYVIKGANETNISLETPPQPPTINRKGFFVAEWGVIL